MPNSAQMAVILFDLLPDLITLHAATKNERLRLRIEQYVQRIMAALEAEEDT